MNGTDGRRMNNMKEPKLHKIAFTEDCSPFAETAYTHIYNLVGMHVIGNPQFSKYRQQLLEKLPFADIFEASGLTSDAFCKALGVSYSTFTAYKNGRLILPQARKELALNIAEAVIAVQRNLFFVESPKEKAERETTAKELIKKIEQAPVKDLKKLEAVLN